MVVRKKYAFPLRYEPLLFSYFLQNLIITYYQCYQECLWYFVMLQPNRIVLKFVCHYHHKKKKPLTLPYQLLLFHVMKLSTIKLRWIVDFIFFPHIYSVSLFYISFSSSQVLEISTLSPFTTTVPFFLFQANVCRTTWKFCRSHLTSISD